MRAASRNLFLSIAMLLLVPIAQGAPRDPDQYFFDTTLGDLSEELTLAKEEGKDGILLFFEQEECPFCHRMRTTVLNQPKVQEYFKNHFLIFIMDIESTVELVDFKGNVTSPKAFFEEVARRRGATPVFAFFDLDGNLVVRYTGATSGVDEFMWLGQYVVNDLYETTNFTRYKRERRREQRSRRR